MSDVSVDESAEERSAIEAAIAAGLAELSNTDPRPTEVVVRAPFEVEDVEFSGTPWLDYVLRVQDWLRLDNSVDFDDSAVAATQLFVCMGHRSASTAVAIEGDRVILTDAGLELLRDRVDRAVDLKDKFLENADSTSIEDASQTWIEDWEGVGEDSISGPIQATSQVWPIQNFSARAKGNDLDLSPSYQRGDVWPLKDAQLLIVSILRGIPLPSVILLRPNTEGETPYEVVDGKQRLTAVLRFMGAHPRALDKVREMDAAHPEHRLQELFDKDYPKFRLAWKNATGETLSATKEREYFFPFKLGTVSSTPSGELNEMSGQYYHSIRNLHVTVGGRRVPVRDVFELGTDYAIPVILYTEATPRQIHEVFNLYNKQGKHLNAEEIRNAVYHELNLMRALSVAAGDDEDLEGSTPFLAPHASEVKQITRNLKEYQFGDARYRRTKVLSWLVSLLLADDPGEGGRARMRSTSQQIDFLLQTVQDDSRHALRKTESIAKLLHLVSIAVNAHAASDAWADKFKNTKSAARWQELQLVASLLGVTIAATVLGEATEDALVAVEDELLKATELKSWQRPSKTQTGKQWEFIAGIAIAIAQRMGVPLEEADAQLRANFGLSGVPALLAARDTSIS